MKWNLSKAKTKERNIPVGTCPNCGLEDTPFSCRIEHYTHKVTEKKLTVTFISCPKCDCLINFDEDSYKAVKGYISRQDLIDDGYKETKVIK